MLAEHASRAPRSEPVPVWCSAASTGEEPYSIAMTLIEALGDTLTPPVHRCIATDIDTSVLAKADAGVYPIEQVEQLVARAPASASS